MKHKIKHFYYDASQADTQAVYQLKKQGMTLKAQQQIPKINHYREGKYSLHVSKKQGAAFKPCASLNPEYVCCNVQVLDAVSNCPYDCSYCFLQNYLNNSTLQVTGDVDAMVEEVRVKTARQPWRFFRIGTWELGDSLALEPLTGTSAQLVNAFAGIKNALLELRTKSACVENLLDLDHQQRTVVSWTVNPQTIIKREEYRTASMEARLAAMQRVEQAGYLMALHFDPMLLFEGWEADYQALVKDIFSRISAQRVVWISIGSLRFNPEMKRTIEQNFPGSRLTTAEMVAGPDGKMRYVKPMRVEMYRHLYQTIQACTPAEERPFVYLCMERWDMWDKVLGYHPRSIGHLDYLMVRSLEQRFPGLVHQSPELALYDAN